MANIRFDEINLNNCVCENDLSQIPSTGVTTFVLRADNGYRFEQSPVLSIWGVGQYHLDFTISPDKLQAELTVNFSDYQVSVCDLNASAEPFVYYKNYGAVNVYKVDADILNAFANVRYDNGKYSDLGEYIVSIKRFYNDLGEVTPNKISCADYTSNINCNTPLYDIININCGEVTIPMVNNSALDYETEIEIFLPFIGFQNVSSDYVGKTISLVYEIDIIRGTGTAKLICDNAVFSVFDCIPCADVLFKPLNYQQNIIANVDKSTYGLTPHLLVKSYRNENNYQATAENKRMSLARDWNFGRWSEIEFPKLTATSQLYAPEILEEIEFLLNRGVYLTPQ